MGIPKEDCHMEMKQILVFSNKKVEQGERPNIDISWGSELPDEMVDLPSFSNDKNSFSKRCTVMVLVVIVNNKIEQLK